MYEYLDLDGIQVPKYNGDTHIIYTGSMHALCIVLCTREEI